jgi:predicted transcriptional regulator
MKERKSITIDSDIAKEISLAAKDQRRNFSGMIEYACSQYLAIYKKRQRAIKDLKMFD